MLQVGGIKIESAAGWRIFLQVEIREKWNFFLLGLQLEKEERYFDGPLIVIRPLYIREQTPLAEKWLRALFDRVLPAWSWEMPVERELPAKIGRCLPKLFGHNFDRRAKSS